MEHLNRLKLKLKCTSRKQIKSSKGKYLQEPDINILNLSDCTLLYVLQYLDATSLYALGRTCTRFKHLVQDESLWVHVDGRSQPNNTDKWTFCLQNINKKTRHLLLAGHHRSDVLLLSESFISEKLNDLTVLALEHMYIKHLECIELPSTLEELSLKYSYVAQHLRFFNHLKKSNLKTLILDHCQWLRIQDLIIISQYPKLEILSLYMCKKIIEDDRFIIQTEYTSFKSVKVIDARFTGLGDRFIKMVYQNPDIQIIYFQCFPTTYYLERYRRKLDISNGMKMQENSYLSDDEDNNDTSKQSLYKRFGAVNWKEYDSQIIKDETIVVFKNLKANRLSQPKPKSYLYKYPYDECTCGFLKEDSAKIVISPVSPSGNDETQFNHWRDSSQLKDTPKDNYRKRKYYATDSSDSEDENYDDSNHLLLLNKLEYEVKRQKINRSRKVDNINFMLPVGMHLCCQITYDSCTNPEWCQVQSTPKTCYQNWLYVREPRNDYEIAMLEHTDEQYFNTSKHSSSPKNYNCDCKNIPSNTKGHGDHVAYTRIQEPIISSGRPSSEVIPNDDAVKYLIDKVSDCIQLTETIRLDSEVKSVVTEILLAFDKWQNKREFIQLFMDEDFVWCLYRSLHQLSKVIKQDIHQVLSYHHACFKELLTLLQISNVSEKKHFLKRFFTNLSDSEGGVPIQSEDVVDDGLIEPGPSGFVGFSTQSDQNANQLEDSDEDRNNMYMTVCLRKHISYCFKQHSESLGARINHLNRIMRIGGRSFRFVMTPVLEPPRPAVDFITNIKELSFRGFPDVTDAALISLRNMNLDLLDVTGTNVTEIGAKEFMMYNPQCRLIHESACQCQPRLHF